MSGLIDRAVQRGLVRRDASSADGRAVHVSLTERGRDLAAEGAGEMAVLIAPMIAKLAPAERRRLTTLLTKLLG